MRARRIFSATFLLLFLGACGAGPQRTAAEGTAIGTALGAGIGAAVANNRAQGAVIGGMIGALLGTGAGAAVASEQLYYDQEAQAVIADIDELRAMNVRLARANVELRRKIAQTEEDIRFINRAIARGQVSIAQKRQVIVAEIENVEEAKFEVQQQLSNFDRELRDSGYNPNGRLPHEITQVRSEMIYMINQLDAYSRRLRYELS